MSMETIGIGCTCNTTGGPMGCAVHSPYNPNRLGPSKARIVTTRSYRMECVSCQGSGLSRRPLMGSTGFETCKGCNGEGAVTVAETTTAG